MRMLITAKLPLEPFNTMVRNGTAGKTLESIMADLKPEAVYFMEYEGCRCAVMVVNVADPSKIPMVAEPFFLKFNAHITFRPVMTAEDLGRAGLDALGKKWA